MPLPKPRKGESKSTFVARFMKDRAAEEFKTQEQRLAVAFSQWREGQSKKKRAKK